MCENNTNRFCYNISTVNNNENYYNNNNGNDGNDKDKDNDNEKASKQIFVSKEKK